MRRPLAAALCAAAFLAACSSSTAPPALALKDVAALAAQLDTIHGGLSQPELKSFSALALPMLAAGLDFHHLDSSMLGMNVEWNSVQRRVFLTTRPGTPNNVLRVTLYQLDNTGLPEPSRTEIGYAYIQFLNEHTGGRPDSASMYITLFDMRQPFGAAVAAWTVWRLPTDAACGQCATITAGTDPIAPGGRFINLTIPYQIPLGGDGAFAGTSTGAGIGFAHSATLPGPSTTAATAGWAFSWQGDSIRTTSGPLHPSGAELIGSMNVTVDGAQVAIVNRTTSGIVAIGKNGQAITNQADTKVLGNLFAVPADIADYIEWPIFVIFFCGC